MRLKFTAFVLALAACAGGCVAIDATAAPPPPPQPPSVSASAAVAPAPCIMAVMGTVSDRESFKRYQAALPALYEKFGGVYLGVARNPEVLEGKVGFESIVLGRWTSCEAARAFWWSPEYRALVEMRKDWGTFDVILIPGLAQPTTRLGPAPPR